MNIRSIQWNNSKSALLAGVVAALAFPPADSHAETRQIFVCTSGSASPIVQKAAGELQAQAASIPLFKALRQAGDAGEIVPRTSEELLSAKAYEVVAHNHLVVLGLRSQDPLLDKVWGFTTTLDEATGQVYAEGWGHLTGDIGWIECDRNPFLHSQKIKSAPEDTVLVKISGNSERGLLAALHAFQKGQLSGLVPAGAIKRSQQTILDMDPCLDPIPVRLPEAIEVGKEMAFLAGWLQIGAAEYRAILEASSSEPKRIWRAKYLSMHAMEQTGLARYLAGLNRRAYGNCIDIIEFGSAAEARQAAETIVTNKKANLGDKFSGDAFHAVENAGSEKMWEIPQAKDWALLEPYWNVLVTSSGPYMLMSTLPRGSVIAIGGLLGQAPTKTVAK